jgi:hypothetical protein
MCSVAICRDFVSTDSGSWEAIPGSRVGEGSIRSGSSVGRIDRAREGDGLALVVVDITTSQEGLVNAGEGSHERKGKCRLNCQQEKQPHGKHGDSLLVVVVLVSWWEMRIRS